MKYIEIKSEGYTFRYDFEPIQSSTETFNPSFIVLQTAQSYTGIKIWFDGEWLYGLGDDGKTYRQSLLWYKNLLHATQEQRLEYEISTIGIHWRKLDEDVSFESFTYNEAEPSREREKLILDRWMSTMQLQSSVCQRIGNTASFFCQHSMHIFIKIGRSGPDVAKMTTFCLYIYGSGVRFYF